MVYFSQFIVFPVDKDPQRQRVTKYIKYERIFIKILDGIEFPMNNRNNKKFVKRVNDKLNLTKRSLSINIFNIIIININFIRYQI